MDLIFSDCHLLCNVYLCIECREQKRKKIFINMCALSVGRRSFGDMCALRKFARLFLYSLTLSLHHLTQRPEQENCCGIKTYSHQHYSPPGRKLWAICVLSPNLAPPFLQPLFFITPSNIQIHSRQLNRPSHQESQEEYLRFQKGSIFWSMVKWFWDFSFWIKGKTYFTKSNLCSVH